jgi:hypothetical protein
LAAERSKALAASGWGVSFLANADDSKATEAVTTCDRAQGETVLKLFFAQVLARQPWVLDFRRKAFRREGQGALIWAPQRIYATPAPAFAAAIGDLYEGFYGGNDSLFNESAAKLGLTGAETVLREHFSGAREGLVEFRLVRFQQTFAAIFEHCALKGIALDPGFFTLGLALLGLYEHLESSPCSYDVNRCYQEAKILSPRTLG